MGAGRKTVFSREVYLSRRALPAERARTFRAMQGTLAKAFQALGGKAGWLQVRAVEAVKEVGV